MLGTCVNIFSTLFEMFITEQMSLSDFNHSPPPALHYAHTLPASQAIPKIIIVMIGDIACISIMSGIIDGNLAQWMLTRNKATYPISYNTLKQQKTAQQTFKTVPHETNLLLMAGFLELSFRDVSSIYWWIFLIVCLAHTPLMSFRFPALVIFGIFPLLTL